MSQKRQLICTDREVRKFFEVGGGERLLHTSDGEGGDGWGSSMNVSKDVFSGHEIRDRIHFPKNNLVCDVTTCECGA